MGTTAGDPVIIDGMDGMFLPLLSTEMVLTEAVDPGDDSSDADDY